MATDCLQQRWVFIHHVSAYIPNNWDTEECQNTKANQCTKGDITALVTTMNLNWQHKGEYVMTQWAHDVAGHRGQDDTHHWAREWGIDLPLAMTTQVIRDCEVSAVVKEAWQRKLPFAYTWKNMWKFGEACWQVDYINPLPKSASKEQWP